MKKTFIKELLHRRIPQIIGSYFIASTSMILFLDWLKVNYAFPKEYITLALFGAVSILPSVVIVAYFHGAPGKDEWTKIERIGIPINIIFIFSVLVIGYKGNWWFSQDEYTSISRGELNAHNNIFIPYFDCRNEIINVAKGFVPLLLEEHGENGNPEDYLITQFTSNEKIEIYEKLIRKAKTTFHPEYNIYSHEDIVRSYEETAQIPPDFKTFPSTMETHTVEAELREKILEPFSGSLTDTLYNIVSQIDKNENSNHFFLLINAFKMKPSIGGNEIFSGCDFTNKSVTDIKRNNQNNEIDRTNTISSGFRGENSKNIDELVSDYIELIKSLLEEYNKPQIKAYIQSVQDDKVFIKMTENNLLLTNTEMTLYRAYKYQNKESIQDRIKHIEEFNECCSNNSENDECKQSKKFYEWSNDEYNDLLNESHGYFKGDGTHNIGLDKTVLIEEVYDSIAVGKIITNVSSCYKIIPGDVIEMGN